MTTTKVKFDPEKAKIPAQDSISGFDTINMDSLREMAMEDATNAIQLIFEKLFKKFKKPGVNMKYQFRRMSGLTEQGYLVSFTKGNVWTRLDVNINIDTINILGWNATITIKMDDVKNLLLPRSKIKLKVGKRRLEGKDFAWNFEQTFRKMILYYMTLASLDWTKVSLVDLVRAKTDNFLRSQGIRV